MLAQYLRTLDDVDLAPAARFFTGNPFPQRDDRALAVGGRTLVAAARAAWDIDPEALRGSYRAAGDLGLALGPFVRPPHDLGLFRDTLTPAALMRLLDEIAAASGKNAQKRRQYLCERMLGACTKPLEATYVLKIVTGDLRIGLREGLIADAIGAAFDRQAPAVRRAASAAGDMGAVALAAKHDALDGIGIAYHSPLAFMLASPIPYGTAFKELAHATWLVEDKYDGIRAQAHVAGGRVSLFSRTLNNVAGSYPEIVAALAQLPQNCILDGEIVAERDGRVLPFRSLQTRLQRDRPADDLMAEIPVRYVVFDALASGDAFLIDAPLLDRRAAAAELLRDAEPAVRPSPWTTIESATPPERVHELFAEARERGNEGLMFKTPGAPYAAGRRGKAWLKLKRELSTLDCVVVGVEWGHGRRKDVLSDYTFAVRADDGTTLLPIGKAYSGLTDVEIATMTAWFLAHRLPEPLAAQRYAALGLRRHEIVVEPDIVVEIAFDVIHRSSLHASGYALRFPRIVRLRDDKPAAEIDTIGRVREIETAMLGREATPAPGLLSG